MKQEQYTIWQDEHLDLDDWRDELSGSNPQLETEDDLYEEMVALNAMYLDDERMNLGNITIPDGILCIAQLDLWNGTPSAYKHIETGSVSDAQIERLEDLILKGENYEPTLRRLTYRLGDLIGDVYGWTFPHRPAVSKN